MGATFEKCEWSIFVLLLTDLINNLTGRRQKLDYGNNSATCKILKEKLDEWEIMAAVLGSL